MSHWNLWPDDLQAGISHLTILQSMILVGIGGLFGYFRGGS